MHEELWSQLGGLDRQKTAQRAKCKYLYNRDCFTITLLSHQYVVDSAKRQIYSAPSQSVSAEASFLEQLCILAYLINSKELPLANKLVKAESLPRAEFFFRGAHALPTGKLAEVFGANPSLLCQASMQFGAKKCNFGDASVEIPVLSRVPLTFVVWGSDNEFDARASILFDRTVFDQLPLDALLAVVDLTVDAVITSVDIDG